jgi:hypothetical protein
MADIEVPTNVMPLRPTAKDPTAALRARRARRKRKTAPRTVTVPVPAVTVEQAEKSSEIKPASRWIVTLHVTLRVTAPMRLRTPLRCRSQPCPPAFPSPA